MKQKGLLILAAILLALLNVNAQKLSVIVAQNCKTSIQLGTLILQQDQTYQLPVGAATDLQLELKNPTNQNFELTIQRDAEKDIKLNSAFFAANPSIKFDDQLNANVNGETWNLSRPFTIIAGCKDIISSIITAKLKPIDTVTSTVINTTQKQQAQEPLYNPGSAVYDALKLADNTNLRESEFIRIIQFYFGTDLDDISKAKIAAGKNPFMKGFTFNPNKRESAAARAGGSLLGGLSMSSIGGLDVTAVSDGIARFLAKRVKEELNAFFFQKLKETLEKNQYRDLRTLFPGTYQLLQAMGDEIYNYEKYIQNLREAFKNDINVLDENLPGIIDNHPAFFTTHHEMAAILRSGCYVAGELKRQVHPGDILQNYPMEFLESESQNIKGSIQSLQLLSASMRDTTSADTSYWVSIKYVRQLVNNKKALQIYLGLVLEMAKRNYEDVKFADNHSLRAWLEALAPQFSNFYDPYKRFVLQFAERTETLNKMIRDYQKPATDSLALEQYKKYFDATVDLIEQASEVGKLPGPDRSDFLSALPGMLAPYFQLQQDVSDLVIEINRKNYSAAINNVTEIYQFVKTRTRKNDLATQRSLLVEVKAGRAPGSSPTEAQLNTSIKQLEDSTAVDQDVLMTLAKYGSFISTVATAKTSAEVQDALESFALPAGSARIKRRSAFNVALNGYAGLFTGHEKIHGAENKGLNSFGVAAPVGIAISVGHPNAKRAFSNTLFFSLIDLGALTAFRFRDDSTESVPTIQLKNILSPGVFYSLGLPNSPISINLGYQMGPLLRSVKTTGNTIVEDKYSRISLSIVVDIPIFNFYNKSF